MSKHTPGPWTVSGNIVVKTKHNGDLVVARVGLQYGEEAANSRLIAAAPDMLAWLKQAQNQMPPGELLDQIRALIHQAEGDK